jgi:hypothetical protein
MPKDTREMFVPSAAGPNARTALALCRALVCTLVLLPCVLQVQGQSETDVFLATLRLSEGSLQVSDLENISRNPGYDNQPSFPGGQGLLYARTRNGQTDIARFSLPERSTAWLSDTPGGSEYSPLKIPGREAVSAIRLDTTGLQRLYSYPLSGGAPELLVDDLKVGYHLWVNEHLLVCTVLTEGRMDLVIVNFEDHSQYTYQRGVGRALHRIPGSGRISYTTSEKGVTAIRSMDPQSGATTEVADLPEGVQDFCWLDTTLLLCGKGNELRSLDLRDTPAWKTVVTLENPKSNISRLAYDPASGKLALVIESLE